MIDRSARPLTLVLTSCIDPVINGNRPVQRFRAEERLQDYLDTLKFWLKYPDERITRIIYIDNSGYSLARLQELVAKCNPLARETEFLSLNCNQLVEGLNYGHAEFVLLDRGLSESRLFKQTQLFAKITGRYRFPHLSKLLNQIPPNIEFAADSVDFYSIGIHNKRFIRFRSARTNVGIFISSPEFYNRHLRGIPSEMVPFDWAKSAFVEPLLFQKIRHLHDGKSVILRFPCNCSPVGIGGNNESYQSLRHRVLGIARSIGRRTIPNFWF